MSGPRLVAAVVRLPAQMLRGLVRFYQLFFSAWLGNNCRYEPSCSNYALQALRRHGAVAGSGLAAWRVLRCYPGCKGGCDPVPGRLGPWAPGWLTRRRPETSFRCETEKS